MSVCPDCNGSAMVALCGIVEAVYETPCVLRGGHGGPHYGEDDVASDWRPAASCRTCCVCTCGSLDATIDGTTVCKWCGDERIPGCAP